MSENDDGLDIRTWGAKTPDGAARQAETLAEAQAWIDQALTDALDRAERVGALSRLCVWLEADLVWRVEPFTPGGPGYSAFCDLAELAGVHGFGRYVRSAQTLIRDGLEAGARAAKAARAADANGGGDAQGRRPVPRWALPPQIRAAVESRAGGRLIPPNRHGLADADEWWGVGSDGVLRHFREVVKRTPDGDESSELKTRVVASHPIWVVERGQDVEHGHEVVTLAWRGESGPGAAEGSGVWRTRTVGRQVIADPRKLVELAQDGAPVTAGDVARGLVDWLADLLTDRTYRGVVGASAAVAPRLGWIGLDPGAPDGWVGPTAADGTGGWIGAREGAEPVRLMAPDGLEALGLALRPVGRAESLADIMATATPTLWCAVGAALCSPLLRPLGLQGWILDIAGATSGGKTSALTVAAAVWGAPDSLIRTWRDTDVFLFATAAFLGNVPVYLDDTKTEADPKRIARVVYSLTSGVERGRGAADGGVRALRTWRSVGILTGEQPLTSFSSDAGTRARVLPLWGQVFRGADEAERATLAARRSWGHLGAGFVQSLARPGEIERARGIHEEMAEWLRTEIGPQGDGVAMRLRLPAAAVLCALRMAVEAGLLTMSAVAWGEVQAALLGSLKAGAADADQPLAALLAVESERLAHPDRWALAAVAAAVSDVPSAGWAGVYDPDKGEVYWLPGALDQALTRAGFRPTEILARWQDRGWRALDPNGANPRRTLAGSRGRFVGLRLAAALPDATMPSPIKGERWPEGDDVATFD
jgi:hypothetical protein